MDKILVVDDMEANRSLLRQVLASLHGYKVIEASGGEEAVLVFEQETPDLILMDIDMPGVDGCQAAGRIKALTGNSYTPIIFVTALSEVTSLSAALAAGGDDFVSKPFNLEVLVSRIRAHLRIRKLNRQLETKNTELQAHNQRLTWEQELIEHFFTSALQRSDMDSEFIRFHMSPLSVFNGDLLLTERGPQGGLYLVMGDFTGHGLTAAMGTLPVATIFFRLAQQGLALSDLARELNGQLNRLLPPGIFFAATLLELNPRGDRLSVWKGGMPESCWLSAKGELRGTITSRHMPLGILTDEEFEDAVEGFAVSPGDRLYLYSDGLTEARDSNGNIFGEAYTRDLLLNNGDGRFDCVLEAFRTFTRQQRQADDITLAELTCQPLGPRDTGRMPVEPEPVPWRFAMSLNAEDIRKHDPVAQLSAMFTGLPALARHRGVLTTIISEMYSNAVDHGILTMESVNKNTEVGFVSYYEERARRLQQLQEAYVNFELDFRPDPPSPHLIIRVADSGGGHNGGMAVDDSQSLYGRGLVILTGLCEDVHFDDTGRILEVKYQL